MKRKLIQLISSVLVLITLASTTTSAPPNSLYGRWRMVSGKTNGLPNPQMATDRDWKFNKDNTFEGKVYVNDMPRPFNQGVFMLPNDTTLVTIHADNSGKLSNLAYTYNYHIKNDTLHLYGFYTTNVKDKPGLLQLMHIDEKWVKVK
ncbi:MAG: hypothetical protein ACQESQ_06735 [Bacteroidota bacterium]